MRFAVAVKDQSFLTIAYASDVKHHWDTNQIVG